jgi:hypothetical protein
MKRTIAVLLLATVLGTATPGLAEASPADGDAADVFDSDQVVEAALSGTLDDVLVETSPLACSPGEYLEIIVRGGCCGEYPNRVCF